MLVVLPCVHSYNQWRQPSAGSSFILNVKTWLIKENIKPLLQKLNCSFKQTANFPVPLPNWVNSFWHTNKTSLTRLETLVIKVIHQREQIWRLPTFLYQCQILLQSWAGNVLIKTCDVNQLLLSYLECRGASENIQKTLSKVVTIGSCIVLMRQITIIEEELKINKQRKNINAIHSLNTIQWL